METLLQFTVERDGPHAFRLIPSFGPVPLSGGDINIPPLQFTAVGDGVLKAVDVRLIIAAGAASGQVRARGR